LVTRNIEFGFLETRALLALEEAGAVFVSSGELAGILGLSSNRVNKLAWQLARKKRLIRLKKGVYLFAPLKAGREGYWSENALLFVPELMGKKGYYVGFWSALNYYGLTEQIPLTVQIVSTSRLHNFKALATRFEFVKVRKLGEWREERIGGKTVRFASIEQLIVDCLSQPEHCGGVKEACKALWEARKKIDWRKLEGIALNTSVVVQRRLGYLAELLELREFKKRKLSGWRWLDSSGVKKELGKSVEWGL
jgi:predicted transcriptional regulator of viral defense system